MGRAYAPTDFAAHYGPLGASTALTWGCVTALMALCTATAGSALTAGWRSKG